MVPFPPEQAVKLRQCLSHIDELEAHKKEIEQEILLIVEPFSAVLDFLYSLPGLDSNPMTAIAILSEIGPDMSVFPSSKNLVSRAGFCPRNDQSANKVESTRISRAGCYLKPLLVQIANALIKSKKHPEFKERYHRIKTRRGHKKGKQEFNPTVACCTSQAQSICDMVSSNIGVGFIPAGYKVPPNLITCFSLDAPQILNQAGPGVCVCKPERSAGFMNADPAKQKRISRGINNLRDILFPNAAAKGCESPASA
ncbi:transposase [Lachnospiraceae bacterium 54-53]